LSRLLCLALPDYQGKVIWQGNDLLIRIKVIPNAKKTEIIGWEALADEGMLEQGWALKIRLAAPPVDGKANRVLCEFLAKMLGVTKKSVELVSGDTSRLKRVRVLQPKSLKVLLELES
jgi:uncharacterized protein (TIGR00251 family)